MEIAHLYIYGVIDSWQDQGAEDYGYVNLKSVKAQLDNQQGFKEIEVHIHSEGGVVTEGFAIHDFIRAQGVPVTTRIDGVCASIATVILLAGDTRIGTENAKPFIHNPWGFAGGDKDEMRKYADELETVENDIADFYAKKTQLTKDEALDYMRNETTFTAEEALGNGLLTKIETVMRAVALLKTKNNSNMAKENLTKEEAQTMLDTMLNKITKAFKPNKKKPQNKTVTDANGVELLFADVADDAAEAVGDKATIDGVAAEGDYLLPDGQTYVFSAGELTEIKPKEEDGGGEDVDALKATIADLESQLEAAQNLAQANKDKSKERKSEVKALTKTLEGLEKDMKTLNKNLGSNFKYDPKKKNFKKEADTKRSVFKQKEEA